MPPPMSNLPRILQGLTADPTGQLGRGSMQNQPSLANSSLRPDQFGRMPVRPMPPPQGPPQGPPGMPPQGPPQAPQQGIGGRLAQNAPLLALMALAASKGGRAGVAGLVQGYQNAQAQRQAAEQEQAKFQIEQDDRRMELEDRERTIQNEKDEKLNDILSRFWDSARAVDPNTGEPMSPEAIENLRAYYQMSADNVGVGEEFKSQATSLAPQTRSSLRSIRIQKAIESLNPELLQDALDVQGRINVSGVGPVEFAEWSPMVNTAGGRLTVEKDAPGPNVGTFEDYVTRTYGDSPTGLQLLEARGAWEGSGRAPAQRPNVGTFEDYVTRRFGQNPTAEQITLARQEYSAAGREADDPAPEGSVPPVPSGETLWESVGMDTTGFLSPLTQTAGRTFGLNIAQPSVAARSRFDNVKGNLLRALAEGSRFTVSERNALERELDVSPGMFTSPDALRTKLRTLDSYLSRLVERKRLDGDEAAVSAIEQFRREMGVPQASTQAGVPGVGERRVINGQLGEWDGTGWLPVSE